MSSGLVTDESTPLLSDPDGNRTGQKAAEAKPVAWVLFPLTAVYYMAYGLTLPIQILIYKLLACQYYWYLKGGHEIFDRGPSDPHDIPDSICGDIKVEQLASSLTTGLYIIDAVCTILSLSVFSVLVSRWGRKISLLLPVACTCILYATQGAGAYFRGRFGFTILVIGVFFGATASGPLFVLASQLYITDIIPAERRALHFSILSGVQYASMAIATSLGGLMPKWTGVFLSPYLVSVSLMVLCGLAIPSVLRESLTPENRAQLLATSGEPATTSTSGGHSITVRRRVMILLQRVNIFRSLAVLLPSSKPGRRSWSLGLFIVACSIAFSDFASIYSSNLIILTGTSRYHFGPAQMGLVLSMLTSLKAVFLLAVFPTLVIVGRKWYSDRVAQRLLGTSDLAEQEAILDEGNDDNATAGDDERTIANDGGSSIAETIANEANLFDVFLASASWVSDGIVRLFLAAATSTLGYVLPLAFLCLGSGGRAAVIAYATEIVPPRQLDRALAALSMLQAFLIPLSSLVFGGLYTFTVESFPGAAFVLEGVFMTVAGLLVLLLVRPLWRSENEVRS